MESGTSWEEILKPLGAGDPVFRDGWADEDYLEPEFEEPGADPKEYPYTSGNGTRFRVAKYSTASGRQEVFEPSEEDKSATDWLRA